ncbi:MAG: HDOD domain-containing protein [Cycloclasticus sp.]|nr:HDOD domain-containing protein [Cycloclasticus sp.]MBQ0789067.1 HDOD domain-containing protein [Cycloclasticus sp.]
MHHFSFARQPILNLSLDVHAYEFLYRPTDQANDSNHSITAEVLASSIIDLGLDKASNNKLAFINMSYDDIMSPHIESLPANKLVLELLEDIKPDPALVLRAKSLHEKGFTFALDDFIYTPDWDPLIDLADIIKFDLTTTTLQENKALIQQLRTKKITFLAEKVETYQEFEAYRDISCELFQGYFFCKPEHIKGKSITANSSTQTQLLAVVNQPDITLDELKNTIEQDPNLTYMLLKYLNSAYFSFSKPIQSIKQAIVIIGINNLTKWVTLLSLRNMSSKPSELLRISLVRAKLAELIAVEKKFTNSSSFFLAGLLSNIDAMLDSTMQNIIPPMSLDSDIANALLHREGAIGQVLTNITEYENQNALPTGIEISSAYLEACQWTDQTLNSLIS